MDTYKAEVAEKALEHGASIINDVSALTWEPDLVKTIVKYDAGLILNHMRGTPETWARLGPMKDVMGTLLAELEAAVHRATRAGVPRDRIVIDPGIGFGKRGEQNSEILAQARRVDAVAAAHPGGCFAKEIPIAGRSGFAGLCDGRSRDNSGTEWRGDSPGSQRRCNEAGGADGRRDHRSNAGAGRTSTREAEGRRDGRAEAPPAGPACTAGKTRGRRPEPIRAEPKPVERKPHERPRRPFERRTDFPDQRPPERKPYERRADDRRPDDRPKPPFRRRDDESADRPERRPYQRSTRPGDSGEKAGQKKPYERRDQPFRRRDDQGGGERPRGPFQRSGGKGDDRPERRPYEKRGPKFGSGGDKREDRPGNKTTFSSPRRTTIGPRVAVPAVDLRAAAVRLDRSEPGVAVHRSDRVVHRVAVRRSAPSAGTSGNNAYPGPQPRFSGSACRTQRRAGFPGRRPDGDSEMIRDGHRCLHNRRQRIRETQWLLAALHRRQPATSRLLDD